MPHPEVTLDTIVSELRALRTYMHKDSAEFAQKNRFFMEDIIKSQQEGQAAKSAPGDGGYPTNPFDATDTTSTFGSFGPIAMYDDSITGRPSQSYETNAASQVGFLRFDIWGSIAKWFTPMMYRRDAQTADRLRCRSSPCNRKAENETYSLLRKLDAYDESGGRYYRHEFGPQTAPSEEETLTRANEVLELRTRNRELMLRLDQLNQPAPTGNAEPDPAIA